MINMVLLINMEQQCFIDQSGNVVIEPQYESASSFSEGLAAVEKDQKIGYINKDGEVVIDFKYATGESFSEGLAAVREGEKLGYINKDGEVVIGFKYFTGKDFSEGLAAVYYDRGYGYINKKGEVIIGYQFSEALEFHNGVAFVGKINTGDEISYGLTNKKGKQITDYQYSSVYLQGFLDTDLATVKDTSYKVIDKKGNVIISLKQKKVLEAKNFFCLEKTMVQQVLLVLLVRQVPLVQ